MTITTPNDDADNDTTPATTPAPGAEDDAGTPGSGEGETTPDGDNDGDNNDGDNDAADTFPREYVEGLRDENKKYRQRAADRDALAERLHTALVAADGRLADADALAFDEAHINDPAALESAITSLIEKSPGLRSIAPDGDIGAGKRGSGAPGVDLIELMRTL